MRPTHSIHELANGFAVFIAVISAVIALASRAQAEVVYTAVDVAISDNGSIAIDLNNDGITDFTVTSVGRVIQCAGPRGFFEYVDVTSSTGNGVATNGWVSALPAHHTISSGLSFYDGPGLMVDFSSCIWPPHTNSGYWIDVKNRYLGLAFQIDGETHYGWARLSVSVGTDTTLTGYAYETSPGVAIKTGQTR